MYGDVNINIEDGNLGRSNVSGTGIQVKIGISALESSSPVLITGSMTAKKIREKLGNCPLADACIDSVEWGAKEIYCLPNNPDIDSVIGNLKHTGSGTGTVKVEGKATNSFDIRVEIKESGNTNEGTLRYSIDKGNTYTEEITIPLSGSLELENTGLILKFTDASGGSDSFVKGDVYEVETTAPGVSNQKVLDAAMKLVNMSKDFEFVHIVGTTSKALWASLVSLANDFVSKYKRPIFFICEGRNAETDETLDDYLAAMEAERKGINSIYLQVVLSHSRYQRIDGRVQDINNAGIITGLYCQAKQSQSIGEVRNFPIPSSKLQKLLPEGISDYLQTLDALGYVTIRQYMGKDDYFVTSANMLAPEGSDFSYAEDVRVLNRLVKEVRKQAVELLQMEIDPGTIDNSVAVIQEELNIPVEKAIGEKIISSGRIELDMENVDILADESMDIRMTYVPMGHVREFNITFAVENPYKATE